MSQLTLERLVEGVRQKRASFGLPMQPGASEEQIASLCKDVQDKFDADLPARHLDLLRMTNGMNENSLYIFSTHFSRDVSSDVHGSESIIIGLVQQNKNIRGDWGEFVHFLIFSSSDQHFHALDLMSGKFLLQPQTTEPPDQVFDTYDELMIHAFSRILEPQFLP